jgi:hypothetical protein
MPPFTAISTAGVPWRRTPKRATLKTYNFFAAEQAFLPVHDKGQTGIFACS